LSKAEAARAFLDRQELSLPETIGQMLALYLPQFEAKEIYIETRFAPEAEHVTADRDKMLQAMRNLVENAWKYTPVGGRVTVATEPAGEGIRVVFSNSGAGIAEADLPYIFERFFRGDRSRSREGGGAGIGLAIVKELIEAHGGRVGAESSGGETRVWFVLPGQKAGTVPGTGS
jgi:signal transduction histidine kinase